MTGAIRNLGGQAVYWCSPAGPRIARESDALDLIGEIVGEDVTWVAIPLERLSPDFFRLRTGIAGAFLQKLVNYGFRVAFVGDLTREVEASDALAAFVVESNRGSHVWFAEDEPALEARLGTLP
ncbi:MAG TPA: DUF4180 domain-containing protein [Bauldia sp.]|nr:DUF4180 domain-containing protein [Bauldia sp.]